MRIAIVDDDPIVCQSLDKLGLTNRTQLAIIWLNAHQ